jgi:tetratricopeptide (TPR) repeat protein
MYEELDLRERAAELSKEIATVSTEPEVLAQAAAVLIDGGARDEGVALAARVDLSKLSDKSAYKLLAKQGGALISSDPGKAATLLERAYGNYATERTPDLIVRVAQAHLAANDVPRAEALLSRLEEEARLNPVDAPQLRTVAVAVGDYLYDKKELARAAESYRRSLLGDDGKSPEYAWAKYQLANVLLQTGDFAGSAQLYAEVSKANSPWSREAAAKAEYARTEQRMREQPVTAKPSSSANAAPGAASS